MRIDNNQLLRFSVIQLLLFLVVAAVSAQKPLTDEQKARQQNVRWQYAEAQKYAEQQKKDNYAGQYVTVKWPRIMAAVGKVEETIEFFSQLKEDEKTSMPIYELQFVRSSLKRPEASIGDNYSEFLFDIATGNLAFYFNTHVYWWCGEEVKVETRCYYNSDGTFSSGSVKLKPVKGVGEPFYPEELQDIDGMDAVRESCRYKTSFDYIANYSME